MNADERANQTPPPGNPAAQDGTNANQPVTGQVPQRSSFRAATATGQIPTTGTVPATGNVPLTGANQTGSTTFNPASGGLPGARPAAAQTAAPAAAQASPLSGAVPAGAAAQRVGAASPAAATAGVNAGPAVTAKVTSTDATGVRKARVMVSRVDVWSAVKISFLLSIAAALMMVVAVHVLWSVLNAMGTWSLAEEWISKLFTEDQEVNLSQFFNYGKVMSAATLVSVINVALLTALGTITALLYNTISRVVGGVYVTLSDD